MLDLVACHPLAPSRPRTLTDCLSFVAKKESAKLTKYEDACVQSGFLFSPMGFHLWGGLGPLGSALMNRLVRQIVGDAQGWIRIHRTSSLWVRFSVTLMTFVARQLLPANSIVPRFHLPPGLLRGFDHAEGPPGDATPMAIDNVTSNSTLPSPTLEPGQLPVAGLASGPLSTRDFGDWVPDDGYSIGPGPIRVHCRSPFPRPS